MTKETLLDHLSRGRTDLVFDLLRLADWQAALHEGQIKASDHGAGWGNGMERKLVGDYLSESRGS